MFTCYFKLSYKYCGEWEVRQKTGLGNVTQEIELEKKKLYWKPQMLMLRNEGTIMLLATVSLDIMGEVSEDQASTLQVLTCYCKLPVVDLCVINIAQVDG